MNVALKMEKKDKSKNILKFEYQVLQHLMGKFAFLVSRCDLMLSDPVIERGLSDAGLI